MIDTGKLEKLARGATPGPWAAGGNWVSTAKGGSVAGKGASIADCARGDQHFIAAANPAAVLELISELKVALIQLDIQRDLAWKRGEERDQLKAENETLRKDAGRYQWYRNSQAGVESYRTQKAWDDHIDAAMAKEKP